MAKEQGQEPAQDLDFGDLDFDLGDLAGAEEQVTEQEEAKPEDNSDQAAVEGDEPSSGEEVTSQEEGGESKETNSEEEGSEEETKAAEEYSTDDTLRLYADLFKEKGRLPSSFDLDSIEGDTPEDKIENQVNAMLEYLDQEKGSYKQNLDQLSKEVNELIESGVEPEEAKGRVADRARIERITDDQLEDSEDLQKYVLRTLYEKKNYSDKDIEKFIKRSEDAGTLYEDSSEARQEIPDIYKEEDKQLAEQAKQQQAERERQRQEVMKKIDEEVKNSIGQELFPGLKMSEKEADKVKEYMTQPVDWEKREDGTEVPISKEVQLRRENPVEFSKRLNYLIHLGYFNKDADLTKIGKRQESETVKKLSKQIKEQQKRDQRDTGASKAKGADKNQRDADWDKSKMPPGLMNWR